VIGEVNKAPARWVADQAARRERRVWLALGAVFVLASVMLALAVGQRLGVGLAGVLLGVVIAAKPYLERYIDNAARWQRGARAERAVGETLNELRAEGWVVLHDVAQAGEGNIDHIAFGPTGVYLIETKQRRYEDAQRRGQPLRTKGVWVVPRAHLLAWLRGQSNRCADSERLAGFANRAAATTARR
jgi:hypothetical protein